MTEQTGKSGFRGCGGHPIADRCRHLAQRGGRPADDQMQLDGEIRLPLCRDYNAVQNLAPIHGLPSPSPAGVAGCHPTRSKGRLPCEPGELHSR